MGKLAQDLKKGFLHMIRSCKTTTTTETEDGEQPKLRSVQRVIRRRGKGIRIKAPRSPKRPEVPKGPPPQTS
ncbi:hypothetical protein CsatB_023696 [Cannabis sativa]|uniref:Uncharacterized protein n=1 Tax=Cannabis sativa TaxID=3483 RepID=A0A803QZM2_CANSA